LQCTGQTSAVLTHPKIVCQKETVAALRHFQHLRAYPPKRFQKPRVLTA
jgi:hypothetical protein